MESDVTWIRQLHISAARFSQSIHSLTQMTARLPSPGQRLMSRLELYRCLGNCLRGVRRSPPLTAAPLSAANSENPKILWWRRWGDRSGGKPGPEDSELGWSQARRWLTRSIYLTMALLLPSRAATRATGHLTLKEVVRRSSGECLDKWTSQQ